MTSAVYIVDGLRTPFCGRETAFAGVDALELGRAALTALLARTGMDPSAIDELIFSGAAPSAHVCDNAPGIASRCGLPSRLTATGLTATGRCGLDGLTQAAEKIAARRGDVFLISAADGSTAEGLRPSERTARRRWLPLKHALDKARGYRDAFKAAGPTPPTSLSDASSGKTGEVLARCWRIPREAQDRWALTSHQRATAARTKAAEELWPVYPRRAPVPVAITADSLARETPTLGVLAELPPAFDAHGGTVTHGNTAPVAHGAVALLIMSEAGLRRTGLSPLGRLVDFAAAGCEPQHVGLGSLPAIAAAEKRTGLTLGDADLIELHETSAAQMIACRAAAQSAEFARSHLDRGTPLGDIPDERLNVNGAGIALGHAAGASGARLVLSALKELRRRHARRALVALPGVGSHGMALWLEAT
jgi:acetyl-CoA acetyltransferase family protein